ncbi:MAG: hypothetical protein HC800_22140 [Phormidesmis sp. RL_2_1]|nr:hypothetical protein [Phormidesmis sp. RL_2_1]
MTSFQSWRAHQPTNSSDELIAELHHRGALPTNTIWLRQVPVNFQMAPIRVVTELYRLRPRVIICCGMAEHRGCLSLERQAMPHPVVPHQAITRQASTLSPASSPAISSPATSSPAILQTSINLSELLLGTLLSEISDDAGRYVCNHLYYSVLQAINAAHWQTVGLFVHVPQLSRENRRLIQHDFVKISRKLAEIY